MTTKRVKKPKILQNITIDKVWHGGIGIGRTSDGKKVLVNGGVLPWSVIDVIVTKGKKDFFEGRVFFVHTLSKEFAEVAAPCPHYFAPWLQTETGGEGSPTVWCGGCKRQQVRYDKQLILKMDIVLDSFRSLKDKLEHAEMRDILPSPSERWYRNKIEYSFGDWKKWDVHNTWALWFHKQGQFSQIVDIHECLLVSPLARKLFHHFKKLCQDSGLPVYNQVRHHWFFRHLVIREGFNTGQFLVNLSVADNTLDPTGIGQWEALQQIFQTDKFLKEHITSFLISRNNGLGDTVYNSETVQNPLWWDSYMFEKLNFVQWEDNSWDSNWATNNSTTIETTFKVSINSFFQTNTHGAERLFGAAAEILGDVRGPLLDLYCGTGTIGIAFQKLGIGDSLYGIEIVPDAIVDAQYNAQINGLTNYYFAAGKAEDLLLSDPAFAKACEETNCIIVDPPRDGLHKNVITFLRNLRNQKPYKLLYISCNPVTLARDMWLLSDMFTARIIQPVDMFPHTHHIETICLMS